MVLGRWQGPGSLESTLTTGATSERAVTTPTHDSSLGVSELPESLE